jgi:uncharacterized membrane protein (DUF373 family)
VQRVAIRALRWGERGVFFLIGVLLFGAAIALLMRGVVVLGELFTSPAGGVITAGSTFLDVMLLVLMVVELAYTVVLSLRGVVLSAEPFLIVGLIAVIRRILVITVGETHDQAPTSMGQSSITELLILTGVVLAFVVSIAILRIRPRTEDLEHIHDED